MPVLSPTLEGFRAAFRRPSLTFAEIMWRWVAGATAASLGVFGLIEYLYTLPVTNGELLFLRTRHPYLVGEAIAHIFRGSMNRAVMALLLAVSLLTILWIVAASVGRIATVRYLLDYFRREVMGYVSAGDVSTALFERAPGSDVASNVSAEEGGSPADGFSKNGSPFGALVRLNFLRAGVALAALCGFAGAAILAGFASPAANPQPGLAFFLFLPLAGLVGFVAWALSWFLSLAGLFAVRDGKDAVGAISAAATFFRERTGGVFAVSTWTGLAHLVAFVGATTIASMPLGFAGILPWRLLLAGILLVTVAYFAFADWLYMARLAGYVCIAEMPQALPGPPVPSPWTPPVRTAPVQTTIDRNELILSDVPNLAVET